MDKHIASEIRRLTLKRRNIDMAIAAFERLEVKDPVLKSIRSGNLIQMKMRQVQS